MANQYFKGKLVRITMTFTVGGALTDPGTVTLKVLTPGGVLSTYTSEIVHDSTGVYHYDVVGSEVGYWNYRCEGTSPAAGVGENYFEILPSKF